MSTSPAVDWPCPVSVPVGAHGLLSASATWLLASSSSSAASCCVSLSRLLPLARPKEAFRGLLPQAAMQPLVPLPRPKRPSGACWLWCSGLLAFLLDAAIVARPRCWYAWVASVDAAERRRGPGRTPNSSTLAVFQPSLAAPKSWPSSQAQHWAAGFTTWIRAPDDLQSHGNGRPPVAQVTIRPSAAQSPSATSQRAHPGIPSIRHITSTSWTRASVWLVIRPRELLAVFWSLARPRPKPQRCCALNPVDPALPG